MVPTAGPRGAGAGVPAWAEVGRAAGGGGAGTQVVVRVRVAAGTEAEAAEAAAEPEATAAVAATKRAPAAAGSKAGAGPGAEARRRGGAGAGAGAAGDRAVATSRWSSPSRLGRPRPLCGPGARQQGSRGQPGRDAAQLQLLSWSRRRVPMATVASLALAPPPHPRMDHAARAGCVS
ncbi:alanine and glycine-rich protein-like [Rattus rattus]|uniref:alanine and glycine-rich protein-like n=1 Tax=Rattus rattus TaxID=10117 RepID=UPI0013F2EF5C|nr:alanine and glycine-rich protein-like [Rattus rattus]